jgi:hypothetical protein
MLRPTQILVSAHDASPVKTTAARSVFDMGGAGASTDDAPQDDEAAPPAQSSSPVVNAFGSAPRRESASPANPPEEQPVVKPSKRTRATGEASPRFKVLSTLMARGDLDPPALIKHTGLDSKQIGNATYQARIAGQIAWIDKDGVWRITAAGKEWASGGANLDHQQRAGKTSPARVKTARRQKPRRGKDLAPDEQQRAGVVAVDGRGRPTAPTATDAPRTFRCAIFNDGSFFITKNGTEIELDAGEHKQLLHYLERLAEPLAPAA